jgi:membrane protease YdiL (CAAX protease family)
MTITTAPEAPYHRLARNHVHHWWRPAVGTLYVAAVWFVVLSVVLLIGHGAAVLAGRPVDADGAAGLGPLGDIAVLCLALAALIPVVFSAARWIQRRHAGGLSSVTGRLRWPWLLRCLGVAAVAVVAYLVGSGLLTAATGGDVGLGDLEWVGVRSFLVTTAVLVLVVPLQSAAEEYGFRGWLLQALGSVMRRPWVPIGVQAVLFAALHGWGTAWGFADLVVFGLLTGWMTVRTGGIEAAIALHVANNLISFVLAGAFGGLATDATAADAPWQAVAVDVPVLLVCTLVILRLAARRGVAVLSPPAPAAPWAPASTPWPDQAALVGEGHGLHPVPQLVRRTARHEP